MGTEDILSSSSSSATWQSLPGTSGTAGKAALGHGEAAERSEGAGRCAAPLQWWQLAKDSNLCASSAPGTRMIIQRSRIYIKWQIGGRVALMRHKHVIKMFCAEVWWLRPHKNRGFFKVPFPLLSFLSTYLFSFISPFLLYIFIIHILGPAGRFCER